jgi:hypothetical protein
MSPARTASLAAALALSSCASPPPPAPVPASAPTAEPSASASAAPEEKPAASASATASAAPEPPPPPALPAVEVVAVDPAPPEGAPPSLTISAPTRNQVIPTKKASSFEIKIGASGWKLGDGGKHLCVVLDRRPCRRVDDLARPLRLADLDGSLDEGQHVISVLARRASGEFVRPQGKRAAFASISFFVGKKGSIVHKDGAPMLFFSAPAEGTPPPEGVLLDYYVANAEIAEGKYVVHASIGGPGIDSGVGLSLAAWKPLRVRNARPGDHLARFSLFHYAAELGESTSHTAVTYGSKPVGGPFAEVTREFRVTKPAAR